MRKIASYFLHNVGFEQMWFMQHYVSCFSPVNNDPVHTIIGAGNGGGKSTTISLLFSLLVPGQDKFLHTYKDPVHTFEDYFDGFYYKPGFSVIEFDAGLNDDSLIEGERNRIVVGQVVCRSQGSDELYRRFFSFRAAGGLSMKTLLDGNGEIAPLAELTGILHCKEWLKAMRVLASKEHPAAFYDTDRQQEWIQHLSGAWRIDYTLSLLQWRYNKREGGTEVKDANTFTDYRDFLHGFMKMCLNESTISSLKKNVESNIKNLSDVPQFEKQLAVFRSMQERFEPFQQATRSLREAIQVRDSELRTARGLAIALERQIGIFQEQHALHKKHAGLHKENAATADRERHEAEARLRGLEKIRHETIIRNNQTIFDAATASSQQAERIVKIHKARRALTDIDGYTAKIGETERQLELAGAEITVLREHAKEAGARYRSVLMAHKVVLDTEKTRNERMALRRKSTKSTLTARMKALEREKDTLTKDIARIETQLEHAVTRLQRLMDNGCILHDESGVAAAKRLRDELAALREQEQAVTATIEETESQIRSKESERVAKDKECLGIKQQADECGREYARGRSMAEALLGQLYEAGLVDTPEVNLESQLVRRSLDGRLNALEERGASLDMKRGILENDRTSVEQFNVAGVDHNVAGVMRALVDAGIQAMPYGSYLAAVLADNPELARQVFLSDPARFSGVQVLDRAALDFAGALTGLSLDRPVMVSLATDKPESLSSDSVIVVHEGNALYNKPAATVFRERLDEQIADLESSRAQIRLEGQSISGWLSGLSAYIREFGSGKLGAIQSREEQLRKQADDLTQWLSETVKTVEELQSCLADHQVSLRAMGVRTDAITNALRQVDEYVKDFEAQQLPWEREKERLDHTLENLSRRLWKCQSLAAKLDESFSRHISEAEQLRFAVRDIDRLLSEVLLFSDESFDLGTDYEPFGKTYEIAYAALKDKEGGKVRDLSDTLEAYRTELNKKLSDYTENYGHFEEAAVRAVAVEGLEVKIRAAEESLKSAQEAVSAAQSRLYTAKGAYDNDLARWERDGLAVTAAEIDEAVGPDAITALILDAEEEIAVAVKVRDEARSAEKREDKLADKATEDRLCFVEAHTLIASAIVSLADIESKLEVDVATPALELAVSTAESQQKRLAASISAVQKLNGQVEAAHRKLVHFLESEDVRKAALQESSMMLRDSRAQYDAFVADADNKLRIITDRIKMLEENISKSEEGLQACAKALANGVEHGLRLLRHAVNFRVPGTVRFLGGQHVLRISNLDKLAKPKMPMEEYLRPFIKRLVADGGAISGGDRLVANALCHVAEHMDAKPTVRILKPIPALGRYDHVDISSYSSSSGGEGLTSALMYYLLAAHIRGKEQGRNADFGGALILDNPIGEANLAMLLQAQREIATSLGIQLIYFTGIKDMESMNEFNHHVTLRASRKEDRRSGRRYMEAWSTEMQPGMPEYGTSNSEA